MLTSILFSFSFFKTTFPANVKDFNGKLGDITTIIEENENLTAVIFGADWCIDCIRLERYLSNLATKNPDTLFLRVDVQKYFQFRGIFKIYHIPDVRFYYRNMTQLGQIVEGTGMQVHSELRSIRKVLNLKNPSKKRL